MQYKIPQNIGIEDKIVGPFSLRQLAIVAVGGGISYVLFAISSKAYELNALEYFTIAIPALLALAIALLKINGISFGKYVMLSLEFALKPKKRLWDHRGILSIVDPNLYDAPSAKQTAANAAIVPKTERGDVNLTDLTRVLDSGGFDHLEKVKHDDMDKAGDDDLITEAFFGHKREESKTENMYWRTKESQKKRLEFLAKIPAKKMKEEKVAAPVAVKEAPAKKAEKKPDIEVKIPEQKQKQPEVAQAAPTPAPVPPAPAPKPPVQKPAPVAKKPEPAPTPPVKPVAQKPVQKPAPQNDQTPVPNGKKRRKRNRKKKENGAIRQETQVNTIHKDRPVQLIQKESKVTEMPQSESIRIVPQSEALKPPAERPQAEKPQAKAPTPPPAKKEEPKGRSGEIDMEKLRKGETFEFELDKIDLNLD